MRTTLVSLALVATIAVASADGAHSKIHAEMMKEIEEMEFDATNPMFWVQGVRGLYIGLEDGIHKGNPKGQICLDENTQESHLHIVEVVMRQDMGELPKLIPDGMDIFNNVKECLKNKDTIVAWCAAESDRCSIDSIVKHSQSQMF